MTYWAGRACPAAECEQKCLSVSSGSDVTRRHARQFLRAATCALRPLVPCAGQRLRVVPPCCAAHVLVSITERFNEVGS